MEVLTMDKEFNSVAIVDTFESLLWVERFQECGDFELYTPIRDDLITGILEDYYLWLPDSNQVMIVEDIAITTDAEVGPHLKITGRSLESILERRIIWGTMKLSGNLQDAVHRLLNENVISPAIADRKIDGFVFEESDDPHITSLTIEETYAGDNVYGVIKDLCSRNNIGFQVRLSDNNEFVFKLYFGTDRSYDQDATPYILFSPDFENLLNTNYFQSTKTLKNVALVSGDKTEEGALLDLRVVGSAEGLARRELFVDASSVSNTDENNNPIPTATYQANLDEEGRKQLAEHAYTKTFEGEIEPREPFVYGEDYSMGDIVQIINEYGIEAKVRITEVVRSQDENGYSLYPTFSVAE